MQKRIIRKKLIISIITIVVFISILSIVTIINNSNNNDTVEEIIENIELKDIGEKEQNGLIYSNPILVKNKFGIALRLDVLNKTGVDIEQMNKKIIFVNKKGKEVFQMTATISPTKNNESTFIHTIVDSENKQYKKIDILDIYDYRIE